MKFNEPIELRQLLKFIMEIFRFLFSVFVHWSVLHLLFDLFTPLAAWILFGVYGVLFMIVVGYTIYDYEEFKEGEK